MRVTGVQPGSLANHPFKLPKAKDIVIKLGDQYNEIRTTSFGEKESNSIGPALNIFGKGLHG
jgi:hypothetical protein